jgi:hypothetical protein
MSKILISQATLELGRNRQNRRLIARLDNPNQKKGFDTIESCSDTGGDVFCQKTSFHTPPVFCEYKQNCPDNIHKYPMKCIFGKDSCQIRKYLKKLRI